MAMVLVSACGSTGRTDGMEEVSLLSPIPPSVFYYPAFVADELGFFADEGLSLNYENVGEAVSMTSLLANGNVDIATPGSTEVLQGLASGQDFDVVYDYYTLSADAVGVWPDSDIQSVADLDGKTVGIAADDVRSILGAALQAEGLASEDVQIVVIGTSGPTIANSLSKGEIDAFVGSALDFASLESAGAALREITPDLIAHLPASSFAVTPQTLSERRPMVVGFLRAWSKGLYAGMNDPVLVETIMRQVAPEEWVDPDVGAASMEVAMRLQDQRDQEQLGLIQVANWQDAVDQAVQVGDLQSPIDLDTFLDDSLLAEVNDFDHAEVEVRVEEFLGEA